MCKIPISEDLSFAKKSMVAKRNRYKEKFPCKLLYTLCYNHAYVVPPALFQSRKITLSQLSLLCMQSSGILNIHRSLGVLLTHAYKYNIHNCIYVLFHCLFLLYNLLQTLLTTSTLLAVPPTMPLTTSMPP